MSTKKVAVTIKGKTPLLMNAYPMVTVDGMDKKSFEEQAEYRTYRTPERHLYIPGINIQRALIGGATYSKGKGRSTLQKPVSACVMVTPEYCLLNTDEYKVYICPVVMPVTHGRILRARPRIEQWETSFEIEFDDTLLKETELRRVIDDTGERVGILDFRPEKKGSFGRFFVIHWE